MPYALHSIAAPGTLVYGYHAGDPVPDSVVENWGLADGVDVTDDEPEVNAPAPAIVPRPGPEANRAAWESYALANGMSEAEAGAASQEDLEAVQARVPAGEAPAVARPSDSAKKPEWQAYAIAVGADETWATADGTTKAELQAYQPGSPTVDTVALAATEQANG